MGGGNLSNVCAQVRKQPCRVSREPTGAACVTPRLEKLYLQFLRELDNRNSCGARLRAAVAFKWVFFLPLTTKG